MLNKIFILSLLIYLFPVSSINSYLKSYNVNSQANFSSDSSSNDDLPNNDEILACMSEYQNILNNISNGNQNTGTPVNGSVRWSDDNNSLHWCNSVILSIDYRTYGSSNRYIEYFETNDSGIFNYKTVHQMDIGSNIYLRIYAASTYGIVAMDKTPSLYYIEKEIHSQFNSHSPYISNIVWVRDLDTNGRFFGEAFQIAQAATYAAEYAKYLNNNVGLENCSIIYPTKLQSYLDENGGHADAYYTNNSIFIGQEYTSSQLFPNSYASWDTIFHEYAHHVQYNLDIANNPGGTHYINMNMCDVYMEGYKDNSGAFIIQPQSPTNAKSKGVRISWGEGWASFFAVCVSNYFSDEISDIEFQNDNYMTQTNGVHFSLDNPFVYRYGEGSEINIASFMFKISNYDLTADTFDSVAIDDKTLFDVALYTKPDSFSDYLYELNAVYESSYYQEIGKLLEFYRISPYDVELVYPSYGGTGQITWENGACGHNYFPNTRFDLEIRFYAPVNYFYKTNITGNSYTFTYSEWQTYKDYEIERIVIKGYDDNYYATGPYQSSGEFLESYSIM